MCELGAGTGGLTRDTFPLLDFDPNCELLQYTATDISSVWGPRLLEKMKSSKMRFKACALFIIALGRCKNTAHSFTFMS